MPPRARASFAAVLLGLVAAACWSPQNFRLNGYTIDNATAVLRQGEQTFRADVAARGGTVSRPGRCYFLEPLVPTDKDVGCGPVSVPGAGADARWELFPMQVTLANAASTHGVGSLGSPVIGPLRNGDRLVRPDLREIDVRSDDSSDLHISDAPPPPVNPLWIGAAMAAVFVAAAGGLAVWLVRLHFSRPRSSPTAATTIYLPPTTWEAVLRVLAESPVTPDDASETAPPARARQPAYRPLSAAHAGGAAAASSSDEAGVGASGDPDDLTYASEEAAVSGPSVPTITVVLCRPGSVGPAALVGGDGHVAPLRAPP